MARSSCHLLCREKSALFGGKYIQLAPSTAKRVAFYFNLMVHDSQNPQGGLFAEGVASLLQNSFDYRVVIGKQSRL